RCKRSVRSPQGSKDACRARRTRLLRHCGRQPPPLHCAGWKFTDEAHSPKNGGSTMQLRRLLLLQPHARVELENGTATLKRDESDWDVLAELDRLRTTNSGLTAEVQRQTHIGQDYARVASE